MSDGKYFNGAGPANSFNVFFYADNAGLPGAQVIEEAFTIIAANLSSQASPNFHVGPRLTRG
jgi:hypothetical protein